MPKRMRAFGMTEVIGGDGSTAFMLPMQKDGVAGEPPGAHLWFSAANYHLRAQPGLAQVGLATASHSDAAFVLSANSTLWCTGVHR